MTTVADIAKLKQRGGAAATRGDYAEAARCSREILTLDPTDAGAGKSLLLMTRLTGETGDTALPAAFKAYFADFFRARPTLGPTMSPAVMIEEWIRHSGLSPVEIDPAQPCGTTAPYSADPTTMVEIANAGFVPGWDFVLSPAGDVLDGSGYLSLGSALNVMPHVWFPEANRVMHIGGGDPVMINRRALFLSSPALFNVGHWIVDFLPRLRGLHGLTGDVGIVVPKPLPQRYEEFLALFGIDRSRLIECEVGRPHHVTSLIIVRHGDHNRPQPAKIDFLRQHLGPLQNAPAPHKRVLLERGDSTFGRDLTNRSELAGALAQFGFVTHDLAKCCVVEQSAILSQARIVVASRGADLAAIFQIARDADIVALAPEIDPAQPDADMQQFERYAAHLGIRLHWQSCRAVGDAKTPALYRPMTADIDAVIGRVTQLR